MSLMFTWLLVICLAVSIMAWLLAELRERGLLPLHPFAAGAKSPKLMVVLLAAVVAGCIHYVQTPCHVSCLNLVLKPRFRQISGKMPFLVALTCLNPHFLV